MTRSRPSRPPLPDPREVQSAYLPDVPLEHLALAALGKPEAKTPGEVVRLNDHIRRKGNARTARHSEAQGRCEAHLTPEDVTAKGTEWLGL
ncbi:hypothetical protein [Deinococcus aluminii]|uniref:Uncharacterized protein n=1 Tax=Deinococcus aluminii TaxID=1656885 RepID=A0ABP9XEV2_9DEIO